jgi:hypothetical protein
MAEEVHQHQVDRSGWPAGPWDGEPDRWEDRHLGFPVLAIRNDRGAWCGYVGIPPGHPWHSGNYQEPELECHGGLTYAGLCNGVICHVPREGEPAEVLWLGFDCGHAGDLAPTDLIGYMGQLREEIAKRFGRDAGAGDVYRPLTYVQEQTRSMAAAAAAAAR